MNMPFVLVHLAILEAHQTADQSALLVQNVLKTERVSIKNVSIRVLELAARTHVVKSSITMQFALVHLVSLVIHLIGVCQKVSACPIE